MGIKPILFSGPMVRAIRFGRKTVTRRLSGLKDQNVVKCSNSMMYALGHPFIPSVTVPAPYKAGDILWVRETWARTDGTMPELYYLYRADTALPKNGNPIIWKPSIHMPKAAARLFLLVTDVRVERLRDITAEEAEREGFISREQFLEYWNKVLKPEDREKFGIAKNPWIWRIAFERCEKPAKWPS